MMDTANKFKVRSPNGGRTILFEFNTAGVVPLTLDDAKVLAAWLTAITDGEEDVARMVREIKR